MVRGIDNGDGIQFDITYTVPLDEGKICNFRYDPCQYGGILLENLKITMVLFDGTEIEVDLEKAQYNGMKCNRGIYFLLFDPQIAWDYKGEVPVEFVKITGDVNREIPAEVVEEAIAYFSKKQGVKSIIKKFL